MAERMLMTGQNRCYSRAVKETRSGGREDYPCFKVMATVYPGQSTLHPHLLKRRLGTLEQKVTSVAEMNYGNIGICVS